jgi:hypothetical protein
MSHNVQRFATRRQARTLLGHAPLDVTHSVTILHALGAVYSGAREARGGANRIVMCSRFLLAHPIHCYARPEPTQADLSSRNCIRR